MFYDFDTEYPRTNSEKWMELERKFGAEGLIPLWEADMDFRSPKPVIDALVMRAEEGIFGYVHKSGSYNEAIAAWIASKHGVCIDPSWILHAPMVMTAIHLFLDEFSKPGDRIVLQTPAYYPFYDVIPGVGRKAVFNPLQLQEGRYNVDFEDLERKFSEGARVMLLCNPQNPGGSVWTREELEKVGALCLEYDVKVIADEAHADFALFGNKYTPFASVLPGLAENTMTLLSPGKTFNLAGTHQAVILLPEEKMRSRMLRRLGMLDIEKNNCFGLVAVEAGYRYGGEWLSQVISYIEANMDFVIGFCKEKIPRIAAVRPQGTYLMWLDCRALGLGAEALGEFMVKKAKVGMAEGYWFGKEGEGFSRMNVACPRALLERALRQIKEAANCLK